MCDWGWRAVCVICVNPIITLSPDHWTYHRRWLITDNCQLMDSHLGLVTASSPATLYKLAAWPISPPLATSYLCGRKQIISKQKTTISNIYRITLTSKHLPLQYLFVNSLSSNIDSLHTFASWRHVLGHHILLAGKKSFMTKRKAADVALVMAEPGTSRDQWMTNWPK